MNLIQIFIPLYDEQGERFPEHLYSDLSEHFSKVFGGATLYQRAPADGFWKESRDNIVKDDLVIFEIMAKDIDHDYWEHQKQFLQNAFRQQEILIRSLPCTLI